MDRATQLGTHSVPRLVLRFSLPAIVGMLAQAMYAMIDRIFVGQAVGPPGIAGIAVSFPFMLVLLAFAMSIGFGSAALISIRLGERRPQEAEQVLGHAVVLLCGVSVVVTALGLCFLDPLLRVFGASETVLPYAHDYLQIIVAGATFQIVGFGLNASIRGEGNPKIAMVTLLIGVALNIVFAPVLIFGCGWGMRGAALATIMAQAVSAVWVLTYFLSGRSLLRLRRRNLWLRWPVCSAILGIGAPPFFMQLAASVVNSLLNHQLRLYGGDLAISVMGVIHSMAMLVAMPMFGINQGAQPIIGFNYGAQRYDRVKQAVLTALAGACSVACMGFTVAMLCPSQLFRLFDRDDHALIDLGTHAIRICLALLPIVGFQVVSASYFQAVGRPRQAAVLMLSRQVLLLIPAVLILPRFLGLDGVWAAIPTADLGSSLLTGVCVVYELRRLRQREQEVLCPR